jgi:hypothetical protein
MILYGTMKKWNVLFGLILGSAILTASEYKIKTVKILPIESYPARMEISGLTVAVDPYATNEKTYAAFDVKHLNSEGYYPLHVIIKNATSKFYTLKSQNIYMEMSSRIKLYSTPVTLLVDDVVRSGLAPNMSKKLAIGTPLSDFLSKELTNRTVDPGTTSDGFLFFYTSTPRVNPFAGATFVIPKLEEEGFPKSLGPFSIPIYPADASQK